MSRLITRYLTGLFVLLLVFCSPYSFSQGQVHVATRVLSPFVFEEKSQLTGFSVDLWKALTKKMGMKYSFVLKPNVVDLLSSVKSKEADIGIAAISITSERDKEFDFSQPMFDAGLQIMVADKTAKGSEFDTLWSQILASGLFRWLAFIFTVGLIPAHIVWLCEHKHEGALLRHRSYFPGIFEAYWWSLACLATQAEEMPKTAWGRIVAVFWMFTAVIFVAFFTAQVTASMTVEQLQGSIKGPEDLPGKRVATVSGSTSASYLRDIGAKTIEVPDIDKAYSSLLDGEVDAIVYDSPVLQYYSTHDGKGKFETIGEVFKRESYGIVFPQGSLY